MYERCHLEFRNEPKLYKTFENDEQYIIIKKIYLFATKLDSLLKRLIL